MVARLLGPWCVVFIGSMLVAWLVVLYAPPQILYSLFQMFRRKVESREMAEVQLVTELCRALPLVVFDNHSELLCTTYWSSM